MSNTTNCAKCGVVLSYARAPFGGTLIVCACNPHGRRMKSGR